MVSDHSGKKISIRKIGTQTCMSSLTMYICSAYKIPPPFIFLNATFINFHSPAFSDLVSLSTFLRGPVVVFSTFNFQIVCGSITQQTTKSNTFNQLLV